MIRTLLCAATALSLLAGAAQAAPPAAPADTPQVARIRAALKGYLREEKTARITLAPRARRGSVNAYGKTQTGLLICAQVNARTDKGAWSGDRLYLFVLLDQGGVGVWQHGMLRGSDRVIEAQCGRPPRG